MATESVAFWKVIHQGQMQKMHDYIFPVYSINYLLCVLSDALNDAIWLKEYNKGQRVVGKLEINTQLIIEYIAQLL